jgi:hypothetical protein
MIVPVNPRKLRESIIRNKDAPLRARPKIPVIAAVIVVTSM